MPISAKLAGVLAVPGRVRATSVGARRKFDFFHSYQIEQQGEFRSNVSWSDH
jgi:hypothetical protein